MKKLLILATIIGFVVFGAGPVIADEPAGDPLHRHAVWTDWFDSNGNRLPEIPVLSPSDSAPERRVSYQPMGEAEVKAGNFDFIHETEYYDYEEDYKNTA